MMKCIYVDTATDIAYGSVEGVFKMVQTAWSKADAPARVAAFQQIEAGCTSVETLAVLGKFKVYVYTTGDNVVGISRPVANGTGAWTQTESDGTGMYTPHCIIKAIPKAQVLTPKKLMPLHGVNAIKSVNIIGQVTENSKICVAVTADLKTYKTYDFASKSWQDIDIENTAAFLESGIQIGSAGNIPEAAWAEFGAEQLGFAYIIYQKNRLETAKISRTTLTLELIGRWDKAVNGLDYRYGYITGDGISINVTFLRNGSYEMNYTDEDTSREVSSSQEIFGIGCIEKSTEDFVMVDAKGDNLL